MASNGGTGGHSEEANLETLRSERGVWLMKVPKVVAESWKAAEGSSEPIGTVRMTYDPLKGDPSDASQFTFQLLGKAATPDVPHKYTLNTTPSFLPAHIFSETPQGKLAVEGKVDRKFDMQVQAGDTVYRSLMKNRDKVSNTPKRQTQVWDGSSGSAGVLPSMLPLPLARDNKPKGVSRLITPLSKPSDQKRTRMRREDLEAKVFELFEREPYWGLKQLIEATQQPQVFLKNILSDLCVYNKRGSHQGMYELKPEYKKSNAEEDTKPDV